MALPLVTQTEMVNDLADRSGWSKGDVKAFLNHLGEFVEDNVAEGYRIKLSGIVVGPAVTPARKKRMGRNPATGEEVEIAAKPASAKLKAKIVQPLKDLELPSVRKLNNMV